MQSKRYKERYIYRDEDKNMDFDKMRLRQKGEGGDSEAGHYSYIFACTSI